MANDFVSVADHLADALDLASYELDQIRDAAPLMAVLPVQESSNGETHKFAKNATRPVVGFRAENDGRDFDHSTQEIITLNLQILDFSWACDKAVADAWRQGGASAYIAREGMQHLKAALFVLEQNYLYGTGTGNVPAGLVTQDLASLTDTGLIFEPATPGTNAASQSDVFFLRVMESECSMVMKGDGVQLGDTIMQNFIGASGNYPAYYTPACTWACGQFGSQYSVARLCNVEDSLTDDDIFNVLAKFPAGMGPNLIVMHKEKQEILRASRTATNTVGAPAPMVDSVAGIRILTTDAVALDGNVVV